MFFSGAFAVWKLTRGKARGEKEWFSGQVHFGPLPSRGTALEKNVLFTALIVTIIVTDTLLVGIETDSLRGKTWKENIDFWMLDLLFGFVYFSEMVLRMHGSSWEYFACPWNIFDYVCVCLGLATIVQPLWETDVTSALDVRLLKALKTFRLFRLLRVVRFIGGMKSVEGLWLLASGFLKSIGTVLWITLFLVLTTYFFACIVVVVVDGYTYMDFAWPEKDLYTGSVTRGMMTITQIITLDDWSNIARAIIPTAPLAGCAFFVVIFVGTFGLLNIMLAVMVESVRTIVAKTRTKTSLLLRKLDERVQMALAVDFQQYSVDDVLTLSQFKDLMGVEKFSYKLRLLGVKGDHAKRIFDLIDVDKSGTVTAEEFVNGLQKMRGPAQSKDVLRIIGKAQRSYTVARKYVARVQRLSKRADILQRRLDHIGDGILKNLDFKTETARSAAKVRDTAERREKVVTSLEEDDEIEFPEID